eukprot:2585642-Prymnesium_polylepis.1
MARRLADRYCSPGPPKPAHPHIVTHIKWQKRKKCLRGPSAEAGAEVAWGAHRQPPLFFSNEGHRPARDS